MSYTQLVVGKVLTIVYDLYISLSNYSINLTFVLLRVRKDIPRITFILVSASKKVSSKNQILSRLSWSENLAETML